MKIEDSNLLEYTNKFVIKHSRGLTAIFVAVILFRLSQYYYFEGSPFYNFIYLGESLVAASAFAIFYFIGFSLVRLALQAMEKNIVAIFNRLLSEYSSQQTARIISAIKKDDTIEPGIAKYLSEDSIILDTSAIIDGRILGVIKTGFLDNPIIVTQNVIDELQHMADRSDNLKRTKGRLGLDTLKQIRKLSGKNKFKIVNINTKPEEVDKSLVELAKKTKAKLATVDFNLNKAAQVAGVKVLNVNQLSNEIKTNMVPGQIVNLQIVQKGKEKGQGVGYLEDGTMIVVAGGEEYVGLQKGITIERVLQTEAGKMVFATIFTSE